jgi:hypothetical protein
LYGLACVPAGRPPPRVPLFDTSENLTQFGPWEEAERRVRLHAAMIVRRPARIFRLGDGLPAIDLPTVRWPWPITSALMAWSSQQLKYPLGTVILDVVDGHPVVAQVQTHEAFGAHTDWAPRPHKGTSVYALAGSDGKAAHDPPDRWADLDSFSGETTDPPTHGRHDGWGWVPGVLGLALGSAAGGPLGAVAGLTAGVLLSRVRRRGAYLPPSRG